MKETDCGQYESLTVLLNECLQIQTRALIFRKNIHEVHETFTDIFTFSLVSRLID